MATLRIFLSHASADSAFAARLANDLWRAGADVRLDVTHHTGAGDFAAYINQALSDRDVLLLLLSPAALASQWAPAEMNAASVRANQGLMRPPLVAQCAPVPPTEIAGLWTLYQRVDLASDYNSGLPQLLLALGLNPTTTPIQPPASATPLTPPAAPVSPVPPVPPVAAAMPAAPQAMYSGPAVSAPPPYQPAYVPPAPQPRKPAATGFSIGVTLIAGGILAVVLIVLVVIIFELPPMPFLARILRPVLFFRLVGFSGVDILAYILAILSAFIGGLMVSRRTGKVVSGLLAGMGIALIGLFLSVVVSYLIDIIRFRYFWQAFVNASSLGFSLLFILLGGVLGLGAGALGGLVGKGTANPARPPQPQPSPPQP